MHLEAEAPLRPVQAEAERRHEEPLEARIGQTEALRSQMVERIRGDLAARDAGNSAPMARLADLDGRHRALGNKVMHYAQPEAALERACKNIRDEVDDLKTHGTK